ncbi:hypothetical protein BY458DRAFT_535731 [Sporodiniella umbellata]|nr:hypothetical protein BY458DRAFT_535731 [Sporodiniella umbellata]
MSENVEKNSKAEPSESLSNPHSLQSKENISETASLEMKAFVLLSILSLPVYAHQQYPIYYSCMVTGQIIYGLGGGMIITMEEGIFSRWFRDKEVAIVVGITLSAARLTKFIAKLIAFPIVNATGSIAAPIHVGTVLCVLGAFINCIYWLVMWRKGLATMTGKELSHKKPNNQQEQQYTWSYSVLLYIPGIFWMVPLVQLVMSSVLSSFDDVATEYIEFRYQTDSIMAGYQSSLTQVVPIIGAPLLGIFVHRYGQRLTLYTSIHCNPCPTNIYGALELYLGYSSCRNDSVFACAFSWTCIALKFNIATAPS